MSEEEEKVEKKLYVGNIPKVTEKEDLQSLFERCGDVTNIKFIEENIGTSKGWAIVEMNNEDSAKRAIKLLNMYSYRGKNLKVILYKPKEQKSFW